MYEPFLNVCNTEVLYTKLPLTIKQFKRALQTARTNNHVSPCLLTKHHVSPRTMTRTCVPSTPPVRSVFLCRQTAARGRPIFVPSSDAVEDAEDVCVENHVLFSCPRRWEGGGLRSTHATQATESEVPIIGVIQFLGPRPSSKVGDERISPWKHVWREERLENQIVSST